MISGSLSSSAHWGGSLAIAGEDRFDILLPVKAVGLKRDNEPFRPLLSFLECKAAARLLSLYKSATRDIRGEISRSNSSRVAIFLFYGLATPVIVSSAARSFDDTGLIGMYKPPKTIGITVVACLARLRRKSDDTDHVRL